MAAGRPKASYGRRARRAEAVFLDENFDPLREKIELARRLKNDPTADLSLLDRCLGDLIKYLYPQLRSVEIEGHLPTFAELQAQRVEDELTERFNAELRATFKRCGINPDEYAAKCRAQLDEMRAKMTPAEREEFDRKASRPTSELMMDFAEAAGIDIFAEESVE